MLRLRLMPQNVEGVERNLLLSHSFGVAVDGGKKRVNSCPFLLSVELLSMLNHLFIFISRGISNNDNLIDILLFTDLPDLVEKNLVSFISKSSLRLNSSHERFKIGGIF